MAVCLLVCSDAIAIMAALVLSLRLRYDNDAFGAIYSDQISHRFLSICLSVIAYIGAFAAFRLYRYAWRFASLETLWSVIAGNSFGIASTFALQKLIDGSAFPASVLIIQWLLGGALVGGLRVVLRLASLWQSYGNNAIRILQRDLRPRRVLILGGGPSGARLLSALREETNPPYEVIGFLDDRPNKEGIYIRDVKILGPLSLIYKLLDEKAMDEVLVAMPETPGTELREYVLACKKNNVGVKVIPGICDALNGKTHPKLEDISVEDLLRRPPVCIDTTQLGSFIKGRKVLVTGAGGSIGSELCRQIVSHNPAKLILLGHGENSIHLIYSELLRKLPNLAGRLHIAIASVSDELRIDQVFDKYHPEIVFHTAAHKHVPIMETNLEEALQNNVLGSANIAGACGRYKIQHMVAISTDKAVNPSSVMGATKWLCEEVVRAMAEAYPQTKYVTVRFGNVLGSRGSVVPIFHEQIKNGGPVTVTHPEMTRFFMSIREAVQLVLQAAVIGQSGELFLLNMGEPVRVADLAHDMIRLCGYKPNADINILFTGPRPGEKMHEQLTTSEELLQPAKCDGLSIVHRPEYFEDETEMFAILRQVRQMIDSADEYDMKKLLAEVIPGYAAYADISETGVRLRASSATAPATFVRTDGADRNGNI